MANKTNKQRKAEADLFSKIDWEGGFAEALAFLSYGIDLADYPVSPKLKARIEKAVEALKATSPEVESIMEELEKSAEHYADGTY